MTISEFSTAFSNHMLELRRHLKEPAWLVEQNRHHELLVEMVRSFYLPREVAQQLWQPFLDEQILPTQQQHAHNPFLKNTELQLEPLEKVDYYPPLDEPTSQPTSPRLNKLSPKYAVKQQQPSVVDRQLIHDNMSIEDFEFEFSAPAVDDSQARAPEHAPEIDSASVKATQPHRFSAIDQQVEAQSAKRKKSLGVKTSAKLPTSQQKNLDDTSRLYEQQQSVSNAIQGQKKAAPDKPIRKSIITPDLLAPTPVPTQRVKVKSGGGLKKLMLVIITLILLGNAAAVSYMLYQKLATDGQGGDILFTPLFGLDGDTATTPPVNNINTTRTKARPTSGDAQSQTEPADQQNDELAARLNGEAESTADSTMTKAIASSTGTAIASKQSTRERPLSSPRLAQQSLAALKLQASDLNIEPATDQDTALFYLAELSNMNASGYLMRQAHMALEKGYQAASKLATARGDLDRAQSLLNKARIHAQTAKSY